MGRKTYIPKMGTKKPQRLSANYANDYPSFERMLKEWLSRHKDYYSEFKDRMETDFKEGNPVVLEDFKKIYSLLPSLQKKDPSELANAMTFGKNDIDATLAQQTQLQDSKNAPTWRKLFLEDGLDDQSCALLYWYIFDGGQLTAMMAFGKSMAQENLSIEQALQGDYIIRGVVEKGIQTGHYHKNYWEKIFAWSGLSDLKQRIASVLMTVRGKGGRKADFHHAGIGTERRPQQLYNSLVMNPQ